MNDTPPLLLDLFCGAGGAGAGYERAGFRVVGVDLDAKALRHNPHECYLADALEVLDALLDRQVWQGYRLADFAALHASPPCQDYSLAAISQGTRGSGATPRLIVPVRARLIATGLPWILENVTGAAQDMAAPVMVCGTALGIHVRRHRLFDSSHLLFGAGPCRHGDGDVSIGCYKASWCGRRSPVGEYTQADGQKRWRRAFARIADAQEAAGIDWMTLHELGEAVPPVYTEWLGGQLLTAIESTAQAA